MALEVDDDGSGIRVAGQHDGPLVEPASLAEAGFEAGLSVIVEALPSASLVIDGSCRVMVANRAAASLVRDLDAPKTRSELAQAVVDVRGSNTAVFVQIPPGPAGHDTYCIIPLKHSYTEDQQLFLMTLSRDHERQFQNAKPTSPPSRYESAPVPLRNLREEAAKFKRLSETDPLTGSLNVRAFAACVTKALIDVPRRKGAMIFLDLNQFKVINDRFGHSAGDKVLIHVAARLTFPRHTCIVTARMGGDEFALWMPGVQPEHLAAVLDSIRARLRVPVDVSEFCSGPAHISPTAAIGAVCCPDEALNYDAMRHLADKRMYKDKARAKANLKRRQIKGKIKRKGAVDPAPQSFLPR